MTEYKIQDISDVELVKILNAQNTRSLRAKFPK